MINRILENITYRTGPDEDQFDELIEEGIITGYSEVYSDEEYDDDMCGEYRTVVYQFTNRKTNQIGYIQFEWFYNHSSYLGQDGTAKDVQKKTKTVVYYD